MIIIVTAYYTSIQKKYNNNYDNNIILANIKKIHDKVKY